MRIIGTFGIFACLVGILNAQEFFPSPPDVKSTITTNVKYNENLSCAACVLGGYGFCNQGANVKKCCEAGNAACRLDLQCTDN